MLANQKSVTLYQYDLTQGMCAQFSQALTGRYEEGIWHTSLVVFGKEWYFDGGVGVENAAPGTTRFGTPMKKRILGETSKSLSEWTAWVSSVNHNAIPGGFGPMAYDLLKNNCNHFSDAGASFLLPQGSLKAGNTNEREMGIGEEVSGMISRVLGTPLGAMLRPTLETMTTQAQQVQTGQSQHGQARPGQTQQAQARPGQTQQDQARPVGNVGNVLGGIDPNMMMGMMSLLGGGLPMNTGVQSSTPQSNNNNRTSNSHPDGVPTHHPKQNVPPPLFKPNGAVIP